MPGPVVQPRVVAEPQEAVDAADHGGRPDRGEDVEGVLGAGQLGVGDRLLRDGPQRGHELPRLVDVDQGVAAAVHHEERRGVRRSPAAAGRPSRTSARSLHRVLEHHLRRQEPVAQLRGPAARRSRRRSRRRRSAGPRPGRWCRRPRSPGWYSGSFGVRAASAARCPPAEPPVTARKDGSAPYVGTVLADPRDRPLHVDEVRRERVARAEPVVDRDADPAACGHVQHQRDALVLLVPDRPGAAVHVQQHRRVREVGAALPVDVEQAALAVLGVVGDVLEDLDLVVVHPERHRQLAQRRGQVEVGVVAPTAGRGSRRRAPRRARRSTYPLERADWATTIAPSGPPSCAASERQAGAVARPRASSRTPCPRRSARAGAARARWSASRPPSRAPRPGSPGPAGRRSR